MLDTVRVLIGNTQGYIAFVSDRQINVLTSRDLPEGPLSIRVSAGNPSRTTNTFQTVVRKVSPAFFTLDGRYAAATHASGSLVGKEGHFPEAPTITSPAKPGEDVILYGAGFGPTNPPPAEGRIVNRAVPLVNPLTIRIGGVVARIAFAGLSATGLYQFNVTVPENLTDGDAQVLAEIGEVVSPPGVLINVQR